MEAEQFELSDPIAADERRQWAQAAKDDAIAAWVLTVLAAGCFVGLALSSSLGDRLAFLAIGGYAAISGLLGWQIAIGHDEDDPRCEAIGAAATLWLVAWVLFVGWVLFCANAPDRFHAVRIASMWHGAIDGVMAAIYYVGDLIVDAVIAVFNLIMIALAFVLVGVMILARFGGSSVMLLANILLSLGRKKTAGVGNTRSANLRHLRDFDITD